tara:strand:+ start:365 stop:736 length:372 start_codon:yes stop_codon:yes gene_type:complete
MVKNGNYDNKNKGRKENYNAVVDSIGRFRGFSLKVSRSYEIVVYNNNKSRLQEDFCKDLEKMIIDRELNYIKEGDPSHNWQAEVYILDMFSRSETEYKIPSQIETFKRHLDHIKDLLVPKEVG